MRYVIQITARGDVEAVELFGTSPSLKELQGLVGGGIETVPAKHGVLVVNRDHKNDGLPLNEIATEMLRSDVHDFICGDAVLCMDDRDRLIGFLSDRAERIMRGMKEEVPA